MAEARVDTGDIPATGEPEPAGIDAAALAARLQDGGWELIMQMKLARGAIYQYRSRADGRVSYVKRRRGSDWSFAWYFAPLTIPFESLADLAEALAAFDAPASANDGAGDG